ncbi:hypothetical protein M1B74_05975 [Bacteroides pyogenes]|uniref:hypothetical protein n=1 Tax=Bacteroides pyogenes TaxID=310300 RepID=UPI003B436382
MSALSNLLFFLIASIALRLLEFLSNHRIAVFKTKQTKSNTAKATLFLMFVFLCGISYGQSVTEGDLSKPVEQNEGKEIKMIKDFYISYAINVSDSADDRNDTLVRTNLTPDLIAKIRRVTSATNSDPIIRAQDFDKVFANTFNVRQLEGNWYMVSYASGSVDRTNIPIRLRETGGRLLIDYITPEWHGSLYGDSLLCRTEHQVIVDNSTHLSFVKTFYDAYVQAYCDMPVDLSSRLDSLRAKYCSQNALRQIRSANENEDFPGYDLLIDYFDFDQLWIPSIICTPMATGSYRMTYTYWGKSVKSVNIGVVKKGKGYLIDKVWTESRNL